jgi:MFS family permease
MTSAEGPVALRRLLPLYLVVFIGFVGYSLMITVFTPLIVGDDELVGAGASTSERTILLGVLLSLYPFAQFLGAPVIGALSDRFGRRPVLLVSLLASACCYGLIALALDLGSVPLLMGACLLAGFAEANVAIGQSAIADVAPAAERNRLFGYIYLSSSFAYVIGPLAGGKLAAGLGYPAPFLTVAALLIATFAATFLLFRETHEPDPAAEIGLGQAVRNVGAAFAPGRLRPLFLGNFFLYLAIFGFFRVYPLYLVDHFGMGVSRVSEFVAWVAVPVVIANLGLVAIVSRRWRPREITVRFGVALAACLVAVVIPNPENALWVTLGACGLALSLCLPSMAAMISLAVPGERQGRALGTNQSLQVGAEGVSGLAGGSIAAVATSLPLPVMGAMALAGTGLLSRPSAKRAAAGAEGAPPQQLTP